MNDIVQVKNLIYTIRGSKVMLDSDLAQLYEVPTKALNQAVKRNIERFPNHYMFKLTKEEWGQLRSQFVTFKNDVRKYTPYAFTEQGVAMLSSVLKSKRAIQINIQIIDTFVKMRSWALDNKEIMQRLSQFENYFLEHTKENREDFEKIYEAINLLMDRTKPNKIGFKN